LLVEELEKRTLLSALSDAAYQLLNARVTANQTSFYVYQNADSGLNHGFPSGEVVNTHRRDRGRLRRAHTDARWGLRGLMQTPAITSR